MRKRIKVLHLGYEYIDRYFSLQHECAKAYDLSDDFEVTEVYLFGEAPAGHSNLQSGKLVCYNFQKSQIRLSKFSGWKELCTACMVAGWTCCTCCQLTNSSLISVRPGPTSTPAHGAISALEKPAIIIIHLLFNRLKVNLSSLPDPGTAPAISLSEPNGTHTTYPTDTLPGAPT